MGMKRIKGLVVTAAMVAVFVAGYMGIARAEESQGMTVFKSKSQKQKNEVAAKEISKKKKAEQNDDFITDEQAASNGYFLSIHTVKSEGFVELRRREYYVAYYCTPLGEDKKNTFTSKSTPTKTLARVEMSRNFAARYPGSQFNCDNGGGTYVDGNRTFFFQRGKIYKVVEVTGQGITIEDDIYGDSVISRYADPQGYNVVIYADLKNPLNSHFTEVKLPVTLQSAGVTTGDKGYTYGNDEIVKLMNIIYANSYQGMTGNIRPLSLYQFGNYILVDREFRDKFLDVAVKYISQKQAVSQKEKSEENAVPVDKEPVFK